MARHPSAARQAGMLQRLRAGLVLAGWDHAVLRHLQLRRLARALPLYDPRQGKRLTSLRAWQLTEAGLAEAIGSTEPRARRSAAPARLAQIDLEDAIASVSSGDAPVCAALTDLDASAVPTADVSAPKGRSSKPALAAAKPETAHV